MRTLCAVACLMTTDLLSLEQMFAATHRRLHQLSEGPPGPAANKATKILRQFEALMQGPPHTPRQDATNGSHQATNDPSSMSPYSNPLLQAHSADSTNSNHHQLKASQTDTLSTCATHPLNHTLCSVNESLPPLQRVDPVRTVEMDIGSEEPELIADGSPPMSPEHQSAQPCLSRLSLFSGMELVTKGRLLCDRPLCETSQTEFDTMDESLTENQDEQNSVSPVDSPQPCISKTANDTVVSDRSQPVSAFSFLNF